MKTTKNIIQYITEQNMSFEHIAEETGIPVRKFYKKGQEAFNATELFVLCEYLHIAPEAFYTKKIKN